MSNPTMKTHNDMILLRQNFKSSEEAIETLAALAKKHGYVDDKYLPAIKKREIEYPTGLEMPVPIAIPHMETGCLQSFVSIATINDTVEFKFMDMSGDAVNAKIVFLFGIINPKDQLVILQKFAGAFREKEAIEDLLLSDTTSAFLEKLNNLLDGFLIVED